ncbi:MAG TPA: hypothetical protein PLT05_02905 [bacterium]|nr:hypothetical protein [bacterium]
MTDINNTRLAADLLKLYSEGADAFSEEDKQKILEEERITSGQVEIIDTVLEDGAIDLREKALLKRNGFGRNFIEALSGNDGRNALRERVKWLKENINAEEYLRPEKAQERETMITDLVRLKAAHGIALDKKTFDEFVKPEIEKLDANVKDQKADAAGRVAGSSTYGKTRTHLDPLGLDHERSAEKNDAPIPMPLSEWSKNIGNTRQWIVPNAPFDLAELDGNILNVYEGGGVSSDRTESVRNGDQERFSSTICDFWESSSVEALQLVDSYAADSGQLRDKISLFEEKNDFYMKSSEIKNIPDVNGDGKPESLETKTYWIVKDFEFKRDEDVNSRGRDIYEGRSYKSSGYIVQRVVIETLDTGCGEKVVHLRGGTFAFEDKSEARALVIKKSDAKDTSRDTMGAIKIGIDPVAEEGRQEPDYAFLFRFPNR